MEEVNHKSGQRLFISHSSKDYEFASRIVRELEARGVKCWLAPQEIEFSEDYAERLMDALRSCSATLVLVSESMLESRHVRREIEIADSEGHIFYPVRLVDIQLADKLDYFFRAGRWIDLFDGREEARFDELAGLVLKDEEIRTHRKKSRARIAWSVVIIALMALMVLGFMMMRQIGTLDRSIESMSGGLQEPDPYGLSEFHIEFVPVEERYLPQPRLANVYLEGIPGLEPGDPIEATLYRGVDPGSLVPVGEFSGILGEVQYTTGFQVEVTEQSRRVTACLLYTSGETGQRSIAIRRQATNMVDGQALVIDVIGPNETCSSHLATPDLSSSDEELLRQRRINSRATSTSGIVRLVRIAGMPRSPDAVELNFDITGSETLLPSVITFFVDSGETPDQLASFDRVQFMPDSRRYARLIYERPLGEVVRFCVTTGIPNTVLHVHDVGTFRRAEGTFVKLSTESGPVVNEDADYCGNNQGEQDIGEAMVAVERFWADPIPEGSGTFLTSEDGFGRYRWGEFQVGMPYDEAMNLARSVLPGGFEEIAAVSPPIYQANIDVGRSILIEDRMAERSIGLVEYPDNGRLAAFSVRGRFPADVLDMRQLLARMELAFGTQHEPYRLQLRDGFEANWPSLADRSCSRLALQNHGPLGIAARISDSMCPFEISLEVRIWRNQVVDQDTGRFHLVVGNFRDLYNRYAQ